MEWHPHSRPYFGSYQKADLNVLEITVELPLRMFSDTSEGLT